MMMGQIQVLSWILMRWKLMRSLMIVFSGECDDSILVFTFAI
jgi:hypothetical protein